MKFDRRETVATRPHWDGIDNEEGRRITAAAEKGPMTTILTNQTPASPRPAKLAGTPRNDRTGKAGKPRRKAPASSPGWQPEPCPLTREELRRIVIRQLG